MEEKKEYFPNWSTAEKIENAENRQKYAVSVLKSTKTKTALSLSFGAGALAGALAFVATVGVLPAAIVGGIGVVTSATSAIVQKVKSNHAKDVLLFSDEELKVLKQIEVLEMGEPFQELEVNNESSMSYADYLKTVHVVFFDPNGEYGKNLSEIGDKAMKFREEHLEELEAENPLYTMFFFGDDPDELDEDVYEKNVEEYFDQHENDSTDSNQNANIFDEFAEQTEENEVHEKSPKPFKKHDRTKNC